MRRKLIALSMAIGTVAVLGACSNTPTDSTVPETQPTDPTTIEQDPALEDPTTAPGAMDEEGAAGDKSSDPMAPTAPYGDAETESPTDPSAEESYTDTPETDASGTDSTGESSLPPSN